MDTIAYYRNPNVDSSLLHSSTCRSNYCSLSLSLSCQVYIFSNEEYFGADFNAQIDWAEDTLVEVRISKKNTYTTDDARQLSIGQRKCIFRDEVKLSYFPEDYTFSSCMKQCRMAKAIKLCKCNPPFYKPIS